MLDLFCGRGGWTNAFLDAGWDVIGVDLNYYPSYRGRFICADVLDLDQRFIQEMAPDFICASSPCEQFSVHGFKCFHPNPKAPILGLSLFNHTSSICEESGVPYVMENVRSAQEFVGPAIGNSGSFYLWGNSVPPSLPRNLRKGFQTGGAIIQRLKMIDRKALTEYRRKNDMMWSSSGSAKRKEATAKAAEIPPALAKRVAEHAEWVIREGGPRPRESAEQLALSL